MLRNLVRRGMASTSTTTAPLLVIQCERNVLIRAFSSQAIRWAKMTLTTCCVFSKIGRIILVQSSVVAPIVFLISIDL